VRVTVLVRPKPGILDPQGDAIARALSSLGLPVSDARAGKVIDLEVATTDAAEAERIAREAADATLSNGLIETYEIVVP
jgi:phosphoribosylformylglycinamidine synthase PurS subunit